MTLTRLHITIFVGLAAAIWGAVLYLYDVAITKEHVAPFSIVVSVLVVFGLALEYLLWRWSRLHGWLVKRPNLRGTWQVEMKSDWVDPDTGERVPPITAYMGITQTLSTLKMHLMTPESESWLVADSIRPSPSGDGYQVAGVYTNKPKIHLRHSRSEIHLGAFVLDTHGPSSKPDTLTGEYWSDRKTTGHMTLSSRVAEIQTRFEDADRDPRN